jgi:hypothetical protein
VRLVRKANEKEASVLIIPRCHYWVSMDLQFE